jgi:hypothetical protein
VDVSTSPRSLSVHTIVEMAGELDVSAVPRLREELADLIAERSRPRRGPPRRRLHGFDRPW